MKTLNIILLCILLLIVSSCCKPEVIKQNTSTVTTRNIEVKQDTFNLSIKPELQYLSDTAIQIKPFYFNIDTVLVRTMNKKIYRDTVKFYYNMQSNLLNWTMQETPDTNIYELKEHSTTQQIMEPKKTTFEVLWDSIEWIMAIVLAHIIGIIIGYKERG